MTRVWGLTPPERVGRIAAKAGLTMAAADDAGPVLLVNSDYAFDPLWLGFMRERPGAVLTIDGNPAIAHVTGDALDTMPTGAGLAILPAEDHRDFYNKALRKLEWPFLVRLTPEAVPEIERRSYYAAYKGVTDLLTKYLWPEWALLLTRLAARIGLTPNMVTAIGAAFNVAAMIAFWQGHYWAGMALGLVFMVLDTVDGKLARCTITSSGWGEFFDHGIDLVHPPFWWWAWGVGLSKVGLALPQEQFLLLMGLIVAGYVLQRLIEGIFIKRYAMDIHVWKKIDSDFRLITARRNPNMVILFVSLLFGRPDLGLVAVAVWTILSLLFHAIRLLQATARQRSGAAIRSWMG
jgi:phosphatidylglycerophosphate synthase